MTQVFQSKIDFWLLAILVPAMAFMAIAGVRALLAQGWLAAGVLLCSCVLISWLLTGTRYEVTGTELRVVSGPFRWRVEVNEIKEVYATRNPLSSPALSLDRLKIVYGKGRELMISPEDKAGFLSAIGRSEVDVVNK